MWNASAHVTVVSENPAIMVTKLPANQTVASGAPATFTITVTNTGDTDLNTILVYDDSAPECGRNSKGLGRGASMSWTCSHGGETASYYNFVTAQGYSPTGTPVWWNASAHVTVSSGTPAVQATKTPAEQTVSSGGTATWTITVTNTGNTDLAPVNVTDYGPADVIPECSMDFMEGLAPGGSVGYTCSHAGETASYMNVVNVRAFTPEGALVGWNATALVTVESGNPSVMVTKEPAFQEVFPGGPVNFTITVTNTGDTNLDSILVYDSIAPECDRTLKEFSPGRSTSYLCSHEGETESWDNFVTAVGYTPTGSTVMSNATAHVTLLPPPN
jgi:uncharacterized repeat protein (TIGR01451 family)